MLASGEEGAPRDILQFSLASDIVELVVLTADEAFLQTLREAVGGARRLWHVLAPDKVSDLLLAGEVGILVLDVYTLTEAPALFIEQIKRQFPDLVVVVAGHRDAEVALAGLISAGTVYRFIHKPMSPARAKLFADAAVRKYDDHRRRAAAPAPPGQKPRSYRGVLIAAAVGALGVGAMAFWTADRRAPDELEPQSAAGAMRPSTGESPLLTQAATALAANRLTEPPGDNALELYTLAQARDPADSRARAGLAEARERLLAKAENAMLEERLDEAAAAIATARQAGVESGRIAFLTAQLAKARAQVKTALAAVHARNEVKAGTDTVTPLLALSAERMNQGRLIEPELDSALFYLQEALRLDPHGGAALETKTTLAERLLAQTHAAIDARDFTHAAAWLAAATGIAAAAEVGAARDMLAAARRQADADAWTRLAKNAAERLQQDRLIEPANDSAKYYLLTLRGLDPGNAALPAAMQDLGSRLVAKARRALTLGQYDAARSWLDEAATTGFASAEATATRRDLEADLARANFLADIVAAGDLTLVKTVKPAYPKKATLNKTEGWVELDFTVGENGAVKDIAVHAVSAPGVFEEAAISAVSQWRYLPVMRNGAPTAQRARVRIRFVLA